jgi:hypothetical protein
VLALVQAGDDSAESALCINCCPLARSLEDPLYMLLAESMTAFDHLNGESATGSSQAMMMFSTITIVRLSRVSVQ